MSDFLNLTDFHKEDTTPASETVGLRYGKADGVRLPFIFGILFPWINAG